MGRELKKVALDFVWPIGQIWKGFLNPYNSQECKSCNGNGLNKETSKIDEEWYSFDKSNYVPNPFRPEGRNSWLCVKAKAKKLGVYGECDHCNGQGHIFQSEAIKTLHDDWEPFEPPTGDGFQLWETTSEGSPSSPVFETLDLLCEYLETEKVSVFGKNTATKERWKEMLDDGFVSHQDGNMIFI